MTKYLVEVELLNKLGADVIITNAPAWNEGQVNINGIEVIYSVNDDYSVSVYELDNENIEFEEIE